MSETEYAPWDGMDEEEFEEIAMLDLEDQLEIALDKAFPTDAKKPPEGGLDAPHRED
jgi:hypothetical protein